MLVYENYNTRIANEKITKNSYFLIFNNVNIFKIKNIYSFVCTINYALHLLPFSFYLLFNRRFYIMNKITIIKMIYFICVKSYRQNQYFTCNIKNIVMKYIFIFIVTTTVHQCRISFLFPNKLRTISGLIVRLTVD